MLTLQLHTVGISSHIFKKNWNEIISNAFLTSFWHYLINCNNSIPGNKLAAFTK